MEKHGKSIESLQGSCEEYSENKERNKLRKIKKLSITRTKKALENLTRSQTRR